MRIGIFSVRAFDRRLAHLAAPISSGIRQGAEYAPSPAGRRLNTGWLIVLYSLLSCLFVIVLLTKQEISIAFQLSLFSSVKECCWKKLRR